MIKVIDAQTIILGLIKPFGSESINLTDSLERVLAEDIISGSDIPQFDNSAMDGYALRSLDTKNASRNTPIALKIISDLKAGEVCKKILKKAEAIRIMTGAPIPKGADSVVMVEFTERIEDRKQKAEFVKIFKEVEAGENVRSAGQDIKKGECVFKKGALLKSAHIGLLASLGKSKIKVAKKPKVAILSTGDELVGLGKKLSPGKIYSSNTYTLYSQLLECGATPVNLGIAKDRPKELEQKIKEGLKCDLLLTSGGVSVGDYDLVKDVLAKLGADIKFWKVAMRPGKPLVFGMIKNKPVFGLPGNPVSSMVSFEIFVRPAILKMLGQKDNNGRREVESVAAEDINKKHGFRYFLRANTHWKQGIYFTKTTGPQGSGILKSMVLANSLIILPENKKFVKKGEKITVRFLN